MATMGKRKCAKSGCARLVSGTYCDDHKREKVPFEGHVTKRIRGRALQALIADLFARQPYCAHCETRLCDVRDHIKPLHEGGTEALDNVQGLCHECHDIKSQAEAARGRGRAKMFQKKH